MKISELEDQVIILKNELATAKARLKLAKACRERKRIQDKVRRTPALTESHHRICALLERQSMLTAFRISAILYGEDKAQGMANAMKKRLMKMRDKGLVEATEAKSSRSSREYVHWSLTAEGTRRLIKYRLDRRWGPIE